MSHNFCMIWGLSHLCMHRNQWEFFLKCGFLTSIPRNLKFEHIGWDTGVCLSSIPRWFWYSWIINCTLRNAWRGEKHKLKSQEDLDLYWLSPQILGASSVLTMFQLHLSALGDTAVNRTEKNNLYSHGAYMWVGINQIKNKYIKYMECQCDECPEEKEGKEMQQGVGCGGRWVRWTVSLKCIIVKRHEGKGEKILSWYVPRREKS